jgi:beta-glucosidase
MFSIGAIDGRPPGEQNSVAHQMTARLVDEEATVLLKNQDSLLPLDTGKIKSIAVIGDLATRKLAAGGGSTGLKAFYEIPPLDGIIGRAGPGVTVTYAAGFTPQPAGRGGGRGGRRGGATPTTTTAPISTATSVFAPSNAASELAQAVAAARAADVAIVVVGDDHRGSNELEGIDRTTLNLPYSQDELVRQVAAANPKTIVVLITGAPVEMPWIDQTPAVIESWFGGMEGGNAIARVLFGDVNPSGRLPCTFPKRLADTPTATLGNYPGQNGVEHYTEGLLVGYRWYDAKQIEPLFPFGYGLSYTTFDYSELKVAPMASTGSGTDMTATFTIANTGHRDGAEVAEAYVHPLKPGVFRPEKELKGFARAVVAAGKSAAVSIPLNASSFAYYDPDKKKWVAEAGDYEIEIGASSRDIRVKAIVHLDTTTMYDD